MKRADWKLENDFEVLQVEDIGTHSHIFLEDDHDNFLSKFYRCALNMQFSIHFGYHFNKATTLCTKYWISDNSEECCVMRSFGIMPLFLPETIPDNQYAKRCIQPIHTNRLEHAILLSALIRQELDPRLDNQTSLDVKSHHTSVHGRQRESSK